jgi:hypothetical protein
LFSREAHIHGESPGVLFGYGAYGEDLDKSWCSDRLSLLARGWVLAFADVRYSLMPVHFSAYRTALYIILPYSSY